MFLAPYFFFYHRCCSILVVCVVLFDYMNGFALHILLS